MRHVLFAIGLGTLTLVQPRGAAAQDVSSLSGKTMTIHGLAEFKVDEAVLVDGFRVIATPTTRFTGKDVPSWSAMKLGYDVEVKGTVRPDGTLVADEVLAKGREHSDAGRAAVDGALRQEGKWLAGGGAIFRAALSSPEGRLPAADPQYERVKGILERIMPAYVEEPLRLHLVNTPEWNARAMPSGALVVAGGLLKDMDDDEVAIVLGHELAHLTHEHAQKTVADAERRKTMVDLVADLAPGGGWAKLGFTLGGAVALKAWQSGYSRSLEAEADRVGLSYAAAGGYDVRKAPKVWERFRQRYGDPNLVKNALVGEHPRNSDRVKDAIEEIRIHYASFTPNPTVPLKTLANVEPAAKAPVVPATQGANVGAAGRVGGETAPKPVGTAAAAGLQLASGAAAVPAQKEIAVGMSEREVRSLLGAPKDAIVFKTQTKWIYDSVTILFEDGVVTRVEF
jgi:hypothetical protein